MEHFFEMLKYACLAMVSGVHGLVSMLLVINLSLAAVCTKAWRILSDTSLCVKLGILLLLPFVILFSGAILKAPAGHFRSSYEVEPILIYSLFLFDLFLAASTIYRQKGFRWFASAMCLLILWFSSLCVMLSLIAVPNLFV